MSLFLAYRHSPSRGRLRSGPGSGSEVLFHSRYSFSHAERSAERSLTVRLHHLVPQVHCQQGPELDHAGGLLLLLHHALRQFVGKWRHRCTPRVPCSALPACMALEHEPSLPLHSPPRYAMPRDASNPYDGCRCRIRAHFPAVRRPQRELTMLAKDSRCLSLAGV